MGKNITSKETTNEDGEEIRNWYLEMGKGEIVIDINKLLNEDPNECNWIDNNQEYLCVNYTDWDSNELIAIINTNGNIIRKGIYEIQEYIDEFELFVISISGYGLGSEAINYFLEEDDWKKGVINNFGKFIIPPQYNTIDFDEDEKIFYVDRIKFSTSGKELKMN